MMQHKIRNRAALPFHGDVEGRRTAPDIAPATPARLGPYAFAREKRIPGIPAGRSGGVIGDIAGGGCYV